MDCNRECFKIGGPWIDIDPTCPVHKPGGLQDQAEEAEASRASLEARIEALEARVRKLEGR